MSNIIKENTWCPSTTLRNPERCIDFLRAISPLAIHKRLKSSELEADIQIHTVMSRIYRPNILTAKEIAAYDEVSGPDFSYKQAKAIIKRQNYEGGAEMRGRQTLNPLRKLGLIIYDDDNKLSLTEAGKKALRDQTPGEYLLLNGILSYSLENQLPFVNALKLMRNSGSHSLGGWQWLLPFTKTSTSVDELIKDPAFFKSKHGGTVNDKTLKDYTDNIMRWFVSVGLAIQDDTGRYCLDPQQASWVDSLGPKMNIEERAEAYLVNHDPAEVIEKLYLESQAASFNVELGKWFNNCKTEAKQRWTSAPAFYEWSVFRLFQYWNNYETINPRTKLSMQGGPTRHAPPGPDMVVQYPNLRIIVESTLIESSQQVKMEGPSIAKHYHKAGADLGVFVTPSLHPEMARYLKFESRSEGHHFVVLETKKLGTPSQTGIVECLRELQRHVQEPNYILTGDWATKFVNPPCLRLK